MPKPRARVPRAVLPPAVVRPESILPTPLNIGGQYCFRRHEWEAFKRRLSGQPVINEPPPAILEFVKLEPAAREVGRGPWQVKRWLLAARKLQPAE